MSKNVKNSSSASVLTSWHANAKAWTNAVRNKTIQSRALVTDKAITDAAFDLQPKTVLDLGCGEGWLSWHLAEHGIRVLGVDAVADLIDAARKHKPQVTPLALEFRQLAYGNIDQLIHKFAFDLIVCNFSLLDKDDTQTVLHALPHLLTQRGHVLIQTLHPDNVANADTEGWRQESWQSIGDDFTGSAPWYYRNLASWGRLFIECGLQLFSEKVPAHPLTNKPASIIFLLGKAS